MEALIPGVIASNLTGRNLNIDIITLAFMYPVLLGAIPYVGPAFDSAREDIRKLYPRLNISQTFIYNKDSRSNCVEWMSVYEDLLASYYYSSSRKPDGRIDLTVFVMTGCEDVVGVAQFATEQDELIISSVASLPSFADKKKWPTWITTSSMSMRTFRKFYENLSRTFNWSNMAVVCDTSSNPFFPVFAITMRETLAASSKNQINFMRLDSSFTTMEYSSLIRNISTISRVIFYFGHSLPLQKLLIAAAKLNMTNGEYVFIASVPFQHQSFGNFKWQPDTTPESIQVKEALRFLFVIEPSQQADNETDNLFASWKNMSEVHYNYTYGQDELMSPHPTSTYSAMMVLAEVVEKLRQKNSSDLRSGRQMAKHFMNKTFSLKTGRIRINELGERIPVMTLTQTSVDTGKFTVLMEQDPENFQLNVVEKPSWPGVWPVPDKPRCGFRGEAPECQTIIQMNLSTTYGAALGTAIAVILLISAAFLTRFAIQNAAGDSSWWLISEAEIIYVVHLNFENQY